MEGEFFLNLKEISIQVIIISISVFILTMLIKYPIKKLTAKLEENKRKAINTIIVFIPMLLSFLLSILYFGIFEKKWFDVIVYNTAASSYVLAVTIYAVYSRIVILIKGNKNLNLSNTEETAEDKVDLSSIKNTIKEISKVLKLDKNNLENIANKIEKLLAIRNNITNDTLFQNIALAEKLENQISELKLKKDDLTKSISEKEAEITNYQSLLN